jgi:hypothetical protein
VLDVAHANRDVDGRVEHIGERIVELQGEVNRWMTRDEGHERLHRDLVTGLLAHLTHHGRDQGLSGLDFAAR